LIDFHLLLFGPEGRYDFSLQVYSKQIMYPYTEIACKSLS